MGGYFSLGLSALLSHYCSLILFSLFLYLSLGFSVSLPLYIFVSLSLCICMSDSVSASLPVCLFVFPYVRLSVCLSLSLSCSHSPSLLSPHTLFISLSLPLNPQPYLPLHHCLSHCIYMKSKSTCILITKWTQSFEILQSLLKPSVPSCIGGDPLISRASHESWIRRS